LDDFSFDAKLTGKSYWETSKDWGMQEKHFNVLLFYERQCYTISLIGFRELEKGKYMELDDYQSAKSVMQNFEGWSLCVPESFINENWDNYWDKSEEIRPYRKSLNSTGRPATLRIDAENTYSKIYPNGHEGISWPSVTQEINKHANRSMSIDTVKRAVQGLKQSKTSVQK